MRFFGRKTDEELKEELEIMKSKRVAVEQRAEIQKQIAEERNAIRKAKCSGMEKFTDGATKFLKKVSSHVEFENPSLHNRSILRNNSDDKKRLRRII